MNKLFTLILLMLSVFLSACQKSDLLAPTEKISGIYQSFDKRTSYTFSDDGTVVFRQGSVTFDPNLYSIKNNVVHITMRSNGYVDLTIEKDGSLARLGEGHYRK